MRQGTMTDITQVHHPVFARLYARVSRHEPAELRAHRARLVAGLRGRVVEVGAGSGANFTLYPTTVTEVVAVEPEPYLREHAEALPLDDASADAAVTSLVLCSVADQAAALAEVRRVLRPGGELRFFEHVLSRAHGLARFQRFSDATYWPHISGGCHMARDTAPAIERAGFTIESQRRW